MSAITRDSKLWYDLPMESALIEQPEIVKPSKIKPSWRISLADIIEYAERGMGPSEIGRLVGCDPANVIRRLRLAGYRKESAANFTKNKDKVFENLQERFLDSISAADIKKCSADKRVIATAVLEDKIRLIRGQSTQNINTGPMDLEAKEGLARAEASKAEVEALQAQLAAMEAREASIIDVSPGAEGGTNLEVCTKKGSKGSKKKGKGAK